MAFLFFTVCQCPPLCQRLFGDPPPFPRGLCLLLSLYALAVYCFPLSRERSLCTKSTLSMSRCCRSSRLSACSRPGHTLLLFPLSPLLVLCKFHINDTTKFLRSPSFCASPLKAKVPSLRSSRSLPVSYSRECQQPTSCSCGSSLLLCEQTSTWVWMCTHIPVTVSSSFLSFLRQTSHRE